MVNSASNNPLHQFKKGLTESPKPTQPTTVLFFSYDVVNSSKYKTINYYGWAKVLTKLFLNLNVRVKEAINKAELWRILGDEAIFIVRIDNLDDLYNYIDIIFQILQATIRDLKNGSLFVSVEGISQNDLEVLKRQNILSLKGSAWVAVVSNPSDKNGRMDNIFQRYQLDGNHFFNEFLGNDIDAGFRISKFTCGGRLVISFELACLLQEITRIASRLNIVTYTTLKGIWNDRLYPIVWYHNPMHCQGREIVDTFEFDEHVNNSLVNDFIQNRKRPEESLISEPYMYTDCVRAINKILSDRSLADKIEQIKSTIEAATKSSPDYLNTPALEMHCVAVCYDKHSKRILIAQRSGNRSRFPNHWDFGCARVSRDKNLIACIKDQYKILFNIDIEVIVDDSRDDSQPIPVALYSIEKDMDIHKGVIVVAEIQTPFDTSSFESNDDYQKIDWISEDEIEKFSQPSISDFKDTLFKAFKIINESSCITNE